MLSIAILAAGKGTRMESSLPKVLHKISGKSLLQRVIDSCAQLKPDQIFVITGHKSKEVKKSIPNYKKIHVVIQEPQLGTGHAIQVLCREVKNHEGKLLVLNGDVPLIRPSTLKRLLYLHDSKNADVSLITTKKTNPQGYGRVFLKGDFANDPLSMYLSDLLTVPANLAGLPAISIPCGFDTKGLPIGLQLIGNVLEEHRILNAANIFEIDAQVIKNRPLF